MRFTDSLSMVLPLVLACGSSENENPAPTPPTVEEQTEREIPQRRTPPPPAPATETEPQNIALTPEDREIVQLWCERYMEASGETPPYDSRICTSGLELDLEAANESHEHDDESPVNALADCMGSHTDLDTLQGCREAMTRPQ